ncbi:hypothetical protein NQ315_005280 [Exocentrus adspersus]|uniref:Secreted protein n=1 Tax=Exocentrus adspersus TaxID=1586481 RepID=A0AAV8W277_9CUCU|nr:hypothetical protein NQ315_005280 [Exocentrus adspersus]
MNLSRQTKSLFTFCSVVIAAISALVRRKKRLSYGKGTGFVFIENKSRLIECVDRTDPWKWKLLMNGSDSGKVSDDSASYR